MSKNIVRHILFWYVRRMPRHKHRHHHKSTIDEIRSEAMSIQSDVDALTVRLAALVGKLNNLPVEGTPPDLTALTEAVANVEAAVDAKATPTG